MDRLHYYVKHIPKDDDNIFKAISDCLHFTTANWQHEKSFIENKIVTSLENSEDQLNISGLSKVLDEKSLFSDPEITLLLACYFYHRNLKLLGFDGTCSLEELNLDLGFTDCFTMSIIDTESGASEGVKNDVPAAAARYDNLYSKEYINKTRFCQKLLNKILDASLRGTTASLDKTIDNADSFEQDPDEEEPDVLHAKFGNRSLLHIMERSDEDSNYGESDDDSIDDPTPVNIDDSNENFDDEELEISHHSTRDTTQKTTQPEEASKQVLDDAASNQNNKLNKNAKVFKPKTLKKLNTQSSNMSESSANYHDVQNSPQLSSTDVSSYVVPQTTPAQLPAMQQPQQPYMDPQVLTQMNMGYGSQYPQPVQANYMVGQTHGVPKFESGMLISYHSSSMMGIIQSIPSGEQVYVEIGELSSMGIGIDFLYNLARIRLMCSFQKKYVYDQNYSLRPTANNLKIISIDVVQS